MRKIAGTLLLLLAVPLTRAAVINVEFKFTPFIGDPAKDMEVMTVPGKAVVFINNVTNYRTGSARGKITGPL